MREGIAQISNLRRLMAATHGALYRSPGTPGIVPVSGAPGLGKTTAAQHICATEDAVWIEALPDHTPNWILGDLAYNLGAERSYCTRVNFERVIGALRQRPRAVIIDEADRLVKKPNLVETLRAIHDGSAAPLMLIGMSQLPRMINGIPQIRSRAVDWIEFLPCDLRDVKLLAAELCEIEIADDLIKRIQEATAGSARGIRVALERLERLARRRGKRRLALDDVPDEFEFVYNLRRPERRQAERREAEKPTPQLAAVS